MEFFQKAKKVRLRSHHDKYLVAEDDEESVNQERNGSSAAARWTVEPVVHGSFHVIRLKSCYGKYLTASNKPFLLGATGRKVIQSRPSRLDSSVEWEPVRDGALVKLKTRYGHYLRGNGGVPPWRNSVTHDVPHRSATQDWILWNVDVVEILSADSQQQMAAAADQPQSPLHHSDSLDFEPGSPTSSSSRTGRYFRQESTDSFTVGSPPKSEGRTIYYHIADGEGEVDDDGVEGSSFTFKGNEVEELTKRLREECGIEDVIVCTHSPLNGKLFPLRLQLPPNNSDMSVVLVPSTSKREFFCMVRYFHLSQKE